MNTSSQNIDIRVDIDQRMQRIANILILNATFIDNLGLLNGKMGIAIYLYHYARYTGNDSYARLGDELIDEIYEEINVHTPLDFANGLAGIGCGIEYLVNNNFLQADVNEVLQEIDNRIAESDVNDFKGDHSFLTGSIGIGYYLLNRFKTPGWDKSNAYPKSRRLLLYINEAIESLIRESLPEKNENNTELSLLFNHYSDPALFLGQQYKIGMNKETALDMIPKLLGNIEKQYQDNTINPLLATLTYLNASNYLNNNVYLQNANLILKQNNAENLRLLVKDKNCIINSGFAGLYWLSVKIKEYAPNMQISYPGFWIDQMLEINEPDNAIAGFKLPKYDLGLLSGISGIGLTLLQHKKSVEGLC